MATRIIRCSICGKEVSECDCGYARMQGFEVENKALETKDDEETKDFDLSLMTIKELKELAIKNKIQVRSKATKSQIIKQLKTV